MRRHCPLFGNWDFQSMELNFIRICWNVGILWAHSGTFLHHTANLYLFFPPQNTCCCAFSPAAAPLFEVCLMWPDAENELLFRFQSLPKPHLGAMSHTWLLAVIDLRSGRLWHCWEKKRKEKKKTPSTKWDSVVQRLLSSEMNSFIIQLVNRGERESDYFKDSRQV